MPKKVVININITLHNDVLNRLITYNTVIVRCDGL